MLHLKVSGKFMRRMGSSGCSIRAHHLGSVILSVTLILVSKTLQLLVAVVVTPLPRANLASLHGSSKVHVLDEVEAQVRRQPLPLRPVRRLRLAVA